MDVPEGGVRALLGEERSAREELVVEETEFRAGFQERAAVLQVVVVDFAVGLERDATAAEVAVQRGDALPGEVVGRRARRTEEQAHVAGPRAGVR